MIRELSAITIIQSQYAAIITRFDTLTRTVASVFGSRRAHVVKRPTIAAEFIFADEMPDPQVWARAGAAR